MAIVERGNVVLEIADDDIQRYLDKGYNLTDGNGNILQKTTAVTVQELQNLVVKYEAEIKELKAQLAKLTPAETVEITEETAEEKPKRRKRKQVVEE